MEVEFLFSSNSMKKKIKVKETQIIGDVLNSIISNDPAFQNITVSFILSHGCNIDLTKTFKSEKIKNNEILTVMCSEDDEDDKEEESKPIQFKYVKWVINKARVNLPDADLNAFIDKTFDVFKSLNNNFYLICSYSENYKDYDLLCVDITNINNMQIKYMKKNAHSERIFTCSHFLDKYNKRDLLITGSFDRTVKIWDINKGLKLIYNKKPDFEYKENTYLLSECLLGFNKTIYFIASAYEIYSKGYNILLYDINNSNYFKVLPNSKDNTNYLTTFLEFKSPLIIAANCGNIKIFNFANKELIKRFSDNKDSINFLSTVIQTYKDKICLISSSSDGFLRIWDYNNPNILVYKIQSYLNNWLIGLELIDNRYLLAGCANGSVKEFDLLHDCVACTFPRNDNKDPLFTLKFITINGKNYLFSHSHKGLIELWKGFVD